MVPCDLAMHSLPRILRLLTLPPRSITYIYMDDDDDDDTATCYGMVNIYHTHRIPLHDDREASFWLCLNLKEICVSVCTKFHLTPPILLSRFEGNL